VLSNASLHSNTLNVGSVSSTEELRPTTSAQGNGTTSTVKYVNGTEPARAFSGKASSFGDKKQYVRF
jgi:hypothetical protein